MLFLTVKDLAIRSYRNYSWLPASLGTPVSHTVVAIPVYDNAALCWQCCLCGSGVREDLQIKDSTGKKKRGRGNAFCVFVSSGTCSPTCFTVYPQHLSPHNCWERWEVPGQKERPGDYGGETVFALQMLMDVLGTSRQSQTPEWWDYPPSFLLRHVPGGYTFYHFGFFLPHGAF